MMATTRFDMRLDEEIKARAEKASALLGMRSLSEYVIRLMDQDSLQVIAAHEAIQVEDDIFDRFMAACEKVQAPNNALQQAAAYTRAQGMK